MPSVPYVQHDLSIGFARLLDDLADRPALSLCLFAGRHG